MLFGKLLFRDLLLVCDGATADDQVEGEGPPQNMCFCETNRIGFEAIFDGTIDGYGSYDGRAEKMNPVRFSGNECATRGTSVAEYPPLYPLRGGDQCGASASMRGTARRGGAAFSARS